MSKKQHSIDEQAFARLIEVNKQRIVRICRIYAYSLPDQEDLFQDICFQIWRAMPNFKGHAHLNTWLYRIALNVGMRYQQKNKKQRKITHNEGILQWEHSPVPNAATQLEQQEQKERLYAAIRNLKETERAVIMLHLEELSYEEIAEITGLTKTNVGVKINRIKKRLLQLLTPKSTSYER